MEPKPAVQFKKLVQIRKLISPSQATSVLNWTVDKVLEYNLLHLYLLF